MIKGTLQQNQAKITKAIDELPIAYQLLDDAMAILKTHKALTKSELSQLAVYQQEVARAIQGKGHELLILNATGKLTTVTVEEFRSGGVLAVYAESNEPKESHSDIVDFMETQKLWLVDDGFFDDSDDGTDKTGIYGLSMIFSDTSPVVRVECPIGFANSRLNGSKGKVLNSWENQGEKIITVQLLSGPSAGHQWQLNPNHLKLIPSHKVMYRISVSDEWQYKYFNTYPEARSESRNLRGKGFMAYVQHWNRREGAWLWAAQGHEY